MRFRFRIAPSEDFAGVHIEAGRHNPWDTVAVVCGSRSAERLDGSRESRQSVAGAHASLWAASIMERSNGGGRPTVTVQTLLNTLERERHARVALMVAFESELCALVSKESTRALVRNAARGEQPIAEEDFQTVLQELRRACAQLD